ncbi:MAG: hypothetical protein QOE12_2284 [Mycobacterium sp.]|jgi:hypothetical protein|nr:hypothetical protein [Mycobacterium sp.]MDT7735110.1 hypothetical protein [Mycobacterium sp.]
MANTNIAALLALVNRIRELNGDDALHRLEAALRTERAPFCNTLF